MSYLCYDPRWLRLDDGICAACSEDWELDFLEVWADHRFMFTGCCEAVCQAASDLVSAADEWPEDATALMIELGADGIFGSQTLRRVANDYDAAGIFLDFEPTIRPVDYSIAIDFVREHHEHCGGLPGWRFGAGIWNGPTLLGVVIVGNVSGRGFNGRGWLEVRRVCLDRNIPQTLRWRACSMLYRWAACEAERRGWLKLITYTLAEEAGMSLRYARWKQLAIRPARNGWNCASRPRTNPTPLSAKVLWEKALKPSPAAIAARTALEAANSFCRTKTASVTPRQFELGFDQIAA
jgi:hypothetical protein